MINKIIDFSVRNKLITGAVLIIFICWGIYSFTHLSVDALPDVTNNQVQVITNSPNLATQEVEQFITFPLETEFKSLQGLVELRSTSRSGLSVITIVFKDGMAGNITRQLVAEKVKKAGESIPKEYGTPDIVPPTTGLGEIYQYVIVPKKGFENRFTVMDLRTIQDWIVKRQLLGTPGVVDVSSFGGKLKQYEVSVKPERLAAMNLTLIDVFNALQKNNSNTGGSYIDKGPNIYFIRGEGLIEKLDDINNIVVRNYNGIPVLIKDIGTVDFGFAPRYGAMTRNGKGETVGGVVLMQKGENAVRVIGRVQERMKTIEKYLPEGLSIDVFVDRTKLIDRTIRTVSTNLLEGALIVVFVLVIFLGNLRAGLIVASVIPLAMLFAVSLMNLFGVSANLMSMGALDFGLIVDGAVIVVESLTHKFFQKFRGHQLSQSQMDDEVSQGSSRIMSSAIFGQIIILIVYIPIFALSGIEGKMFMPMAQTVSFAIIGAMILSITYVPLVSSLFLNKKIGHRENFTDKIVNWLVSKYQPLLKKVIQIRFAVITIAVVIFVLAILLFNSLGGEFIPELDEGDFATNFTIRQGSSLPQSIETSTQLEKVSLEFPEVREVVSKIGTSEIPTDPMPIESGDIIMVLKDKKEWTSAKDKEELAEKMNARMSVIPGVNLSFEQPIQMRFNELIAGVKSDIAIKIFGTDLEKLFAKGNEVSGLIKNIRGLTDIKVEQVVGMPQLVVKYNRNKIAQYGLNISDVNAILNTAYAGGYAGVVYERERKFDLVVRITKDSNTDPDVLKGLLIPLPNGKQVPLSEIAEVSFRSSPAQISREDAERRIVVEANVRGRDVETVVKDIQEVVDTKLKLPEGYYINYGGQFQNLLEANQRLKLAVPVALLLIFFLLFLTFRSAKEAIIIFSAIPLAAIGGVVALWIRGMNFSISAGVGFIALFGVSVLNGIVLISYYNRLKEEGDGDITSRILKGSAARLRPVLATAAVASLGFLPMAFSTSAGAEVQKPLATVVIGGLVSSTLLTLFVLPTLYSLFYMRLKSKFKINTLILLLFFSIEGFNSFAQTQPLTLGAARDMALKNHPVIQQSKMFVEQQQTLVKTATIFDPLSISSSFGQINSGMFDYYVDISQSFKAPGVYKSEKNLLQQNVNIASASAAVTKNILIRNVTMAYYNWLYAWQQFHLLNELDSTYRDFANYANKKFTVGETGILEKTNAKAQLSNVQLKRKQAEADIHIYESELLQWMVSRGKLVPPTDYIPLDEPLLSDSSDLQDNPLILYNRQKIAFENATVQVEKARGLPSFSVGGATQSIDKVSPYNIFSAGVNIPIFKNGVKTRTRAAQLNVQMAEKEGEKTKLQLFSAFDQLFEQYNKASEQLKFYNTEGLQYAAVILNAAKKGYKAGNIGYVEYVQNINEAIGIKASYLQTVNEYNQTIIQINYLLNK
jgi:cobalt-zinc-cadmium resistance protein CzcA